jgi:hypothetical protein
MLYDIAIETIEQVRAAIIKRVAGIEDYPVPLPSYVLKFSERILLSNAYSSYLETTASVISFDI